MKKICLKIIELIGKKTIHLLEYLGQITNLTKDTFYFVARGAINYKSTVFHMAQLGVNSLFIVIITTAFAGMVLSLELAHIAVRFGMGYMVGGGVAIAMAREFAPMLTAIVVAGRAGSAITAELGSMKVTEQIDALEALATSPIKYLVVPRLLACLIMIPILTLFANASGTFGGYLIAINFVGISSTTYVDSISRMVELSDFGGGLIKAAAFAIIIAFISCHQGFITTGGAQGVGRSTTESVVISIILIFITNYFLSAWLF